jgi:membrane protein DedA with SNARE-associated domain
MIAVAAQQLPGVLHSLEPTLRHYGYLAVAGFVLVEDFGLPVPGETILILAAVYAGTGRLDVLAVAMVGVIAAVAGDNVGFAAGHFGGRRLVSRFGRYVLLPPERVYKATGFFKRHGGKIIVLARFIPGLRQANGIVAGISGIHWKRFLLFNTIGAVLWVGVWTTLGYLSGSHINAIYSAATRYSTYLATAVSIAALLALARGLWRRRGSQLTGPASQGPAPALPTSRLHDQRPAG